jgi:hypothetical protein
LEMCLPLSPSITQIFSFNRLSPRSTLVEAKKSIINKQRV